MKAKYPNLELLDYQARQIILHNKEYLDKIQKMACPEIDFFASVHKQYWGSGVTAFDVDKDGMPVMAPQAITPAYTTVFFEPENKIYIVFVDSKCCYVVENANERFLSDLKNHSLVSVSEAMKVYKNKK